MDWPTLLSQQKLIAMFFTEVLCGSQSGDMLRQRLLAGDFPIHVEAAIDAKNVFDSVVSADVKIPTEQSLIAILLSIREQMATGLMKQLWWVETTDMVSDALTKGAAAREAILLLMATGNWTLSHPSKKGHLIKVL